MNPGTTAAPLSQPLVEPGNRRERGRRPHLPAGRRGARELDRRRVARRGDPGALVERARRLPPHQPRHRRQGPQPTGGRRVALQETRSRDVRRHRRSRTAAQASAQRVRRPVPAPSDGRGAQARDLHPRGHRHARALGGSPMTVATANAAASLRDVTMRFREHVALDAVSTEIECDAITGLLGRNGAGKTTLMQLLAGHRVPTSGSVEVFGERPYENDSVLRGICFIKEGQRYPDRFRVRDALDSAALVFPRWDSDLAASLLGDFDLPAKRPIRKLSRGMNSAVGIIIGLASRAPVTLFDEPYLGLDAVARQLFYDRLLADYAHNPRTVVLSTHLIEEIADLLERVLLIDRGRVLLDADAESLRDSALTVTGPAEKVQAFARQHGLLHTESLGGHARAVVRVGAESDRRAAAAHGLSVESTNLQQLVVAMSLQSPETRGPLRLAPSDDLEEVS